MVLTLFFVYIHRVQSKISGYHSKTNLELSFNELTDYLPLVKTIVSNLNDTFVFLEIEPEKTFSRVSR